MPTTRRLFLQSSLAGGAALTLTGVARGDEDEDVPPTEDLMREHGVLRRILLVYGEAQRRLAANEPLPHEPLAHAAQIVRAFVEDYHERDEEEFIFPRLQKAGKLTDLVAVLLAQHRAGRALTATIQKLATAAGLQSAANKRELADALHKFARMYEPHAAREDTVLFPAFVEVVPQKERKKLQDAFEQREKALPMGDFEKMVDAVAAIEKSLGLYELGQFTPKT